MNGWEKIRLDQMIELQRGHDLPLQERNQGNVPILGSNGVVGFHDQARYSGPGVTIGRSGVIGGATYTDEPYWPLNTCLFVKDFKSNYPRWVYYWLKSADFSAVDSGSAQPSLNRNYIAGYPVWLPSPNEQQAIAEVLGALDDKIAANTKLTQTALKLSRTKFKHLLKKTTNKASLKDVLSLEYGKSLPAPKRRHGDVDVFGSGGILGTHDEALLPGPGVIVGRKGTAGTVHWAPRAYFPIDTTYYVVPRNPSTSLIFCMHLLETLGLNKMNSDSAVPGLNREEALATQVLMPEASEIQKFTGSSTKLFDVIDQANAESRTLASMRDTLLPRLMSGKLMVKQAEEIVASAV